GAVAVVVDHRGAALAVAHRLLAVAGGLASQRRARRWIVGPANALRAARELLALAVGPAVGGGGALHADAGVVTAGAPSLVAGSSGGHRRVGRRAVVADVGRAGQAVHRQIAVVGDGDRRAQR